MQMLFSGTPFPHTQQKEETISHARIKFIFVSLVKKKKKNGSRWVETTGILQKLLNELYVAITIILLFCAVAILPQCVELCSVKQFVSKPTVKPTV